MISEPTRRAFATLAQAWRDLCALRWFRVVVLVAGVILVLRLGLGLLLSRAIDLAIAPRGLACSWEGLDLSILSGRGDVRHLTISDREKPAAKSEPETLAVIDYADFDMELLPLLAGKLRIRRLEIDGMQVDLERDPDGTWNLERHLGAAAPPETSRSEPAAPAEAKVEIRSVDLAPPASIEALRLQDVWIHLVDHTFADPIARDLHVDAGITDFYSADRRMRFSATLTGDRVLDGAHVEGDALWTREKIALELRAQLGGLRPRELAPWLEPLGVRPSCDSIQGRLAAHVDAEVTGKDRDAVRLRANVSDVVLAADGIEALALDRLDVDVDALSGRGATLPRIELSGFRAHASLEPSQALRLAGLDLSTQPPQEGQGSWLDSLGDVFQLALGDRLPDWAVLLVRDDPRAYPWTLGRFALTGGEVHLVDRRVEPAAEFPILVDKIEARDVAHERSTEAHPIQLEADVRVPGTADSVRLEGHVAPFVPKRDLDLTLRADGITLEAMKGYLLSAGLESTVSGGGLRFHLVGDATTDARGVTDGQLDLEETLAIEGRDTSQLGRIRATELHFDPPARSMRLGNVEVSGTQIVLSRDPSRRLVALGMRTLGLGAPPPAPASRPAEKTKGAAAVRPPAPEAELPLVEIGRFAWTKSHLAFVDESVDPPRRLTVDPIGFELTGLVLGGPPGAPEPAPAHFLARAVAPGIFDEWKLEGNVRSKLGGIDLAADLRLSGAGLRGALVKPYLEEIGIEPAMNDGKAALDVHAELRRHEGWRGGLRLSNGAVSDGESTIASLEELRLDDVVASDSGIMIGDLAVVRPFARIERPRESGVRAGGLRFTGSAAPEPAASAPAKLDYPELPPIVLRKAELTGARIAWKDEGVEPAVESELRIEASATDLGTTGAPGRASLHLQVPGTIEAVEISSDVVIGPQGLRIGATVAASGLHAGPLARMLPPGTSLECEDGRFGVALAAEVAPAAEGGLRVRASATDLSWRGGDSEPWLALRRASLEIPRVDPARGVLEIGPIAVEGVSVHAERDAEGGLHAFGMRMGNSPADAAPAAQEKPAAPETPAAPTWTKVALAGDIRLALERFVLRDASLGPGARPLEASVALRVDGPRTLLGGAPQDLPPIPWSVEGALPGLVERWKVEGEARPFADAPALAAVLSATGLRTQGLVELVPAAASAIHGDVEHGTLEGKLDLKLSVRRARPSDLGFGRPFGADLRLEGLAYRSEPQGEILAGVDGIEVDADKIDLAQQIAHVKTVEITRPRGLVRRTETAISACGLAFDLTPRDAAAAADPPDPPAAQAASATEGGHPFELKIERFLVSDVGGGIRDERAEPPHILPLAGLEADVRGLTTRALRERVPIRFHAELKGGSPARAGGGEPKKAPPWFDELSLSGDLALRPEPSGWVRFGLSGLDLPAVAALAPSQIVDVEKGTLDLRTHVKLLGSNQMRVQTTAVFTDLEVKEPKGGPIEHGLSLPVTLDVALFLLRNPAGEHRLSVGFTVDPHGIGSGQIAMAATEAAAQVLATALAGAPMRLVGALVPQGHGKPRGPRAVAEIPFAAGSCELPADLESKILSLRRELAGNRSLELVLRHELGPGDREQAEQRANPPLDECRELVVRGRQRKAELLRARSEATTRARALLAVGDREAKRACEALQALDRELAAVEQRLDRVLDVERTQSERQADKRTRVAALDIAGDRLDAVAAQLRAGLEPEDLERIDRRDPRFDVRADGGPGRVVLELRER